MCISPMVLWWIITCFTFLCYSKKNKTSINTKFHRFLRRHHKMTNLANIKTKKTFKRWTTYPRYVVRMLN